MRLSTFFGLPEYRKGLSCPGCRLGLMLLVLNLSMVLHATEVSELRFRHLTKEDGLSQSWVKSICQDYIGFMWFGTNEGLNRYDGYTFTVYKNIPGNNNSLSNNTINVLLEDINQNLWIGTNEGLNLYNRELDLIVPQVDFAGGFINGIFELEDGRLFITTPVEFLLYDPATKEKQNLYNNGELLSYELFTGGVVQYAATRFFITTRQGLLSLDTSDYSFSWVSLPHQKESSYTVDATAIYQDSGQRIWLGTQQDGLFLIQIGNTPDSIQIQQYTHSPGSKNSLSAGAITSFVEDDQGNLWIGIENYGINLLNLQELEHGNIKFAKHTSNILDNTTILNKSVSGMYKDRSGTLWLSSYNEGLSYYNPSATKFHLLKYETGGSSGIYSTHVNVILDEEEYLWIGTEEGLNRYTKRSDTWDAFTHNPADEKSLGSDAVWALLRDRKGRLWIGTWAGGLNLMNETSGTFSRYLNNPADNSSISNNNIFGITESREGHLWIATMGGGINKFDPELKKFEKFIPQDPEINILGNWVKSLTQVEDGTLWAATGYGLDVINPETYELQRYRHDPESHGTLSSNQVLTVFEDSRKNIWIGTENGLNRFNKQKQSFIYYTEEDGLPNNVIAAICEDRSGNLWISTNNGLSKFENAINLPEQPAFINYTVEDGLQGMEFNSRSCYAGIDGYLYFGGNEGLNYFHPDSISKLTLVPKLILTNLYLFNEKVEPDTLGSPLRKHISLVNGIRLKYYHSVISFQYAALDFITPNRNQYSYFMEGFDQEWQHVGKKREATYTNLNPGKYIFHVKVTNIHGESTREGISLEVVITPPWWKTVWARILFLFLVVGLLILIYYLRMNSLIQQKRMLREEVRIRTAEILDKNKKLELQTNDLNEINTQLEERQQQIEEQAEEIRATAEDLNKTNEDLRESNATKDKFFSIIAHDLKNPFSSILGFCEVLLLRYDNYDDAKRKYLVNVIFQSAKNLYKLLENLLQWSRAQTGSIKYNPEKLIVSQLFDRVFDLTENQADKKGLKLIIIPPERELSIYADKNMIDAVLRNLITNAIKFTNKGDIKLEAKREENFAHISVTDSGIGIPTDRLDAIFQIDRSKSTEGTQGEMGTGLGLIISKDFIEKNKGTIGVHSEENKGSTFYFTVPLA